MAYNSGSVDSEQQSDLQRLLELGEAHFVHQRDRFLEGAGLVGQLLLRRTIFLAVNLHPRTLFLDLNLVMGYWDGDGGRTYHHTAPVNAMYGLHAALSMLKEEGIDNAIKRHADMHSALKAGLEAMGLSLIVDEAYRLPQLNAVSIPEGVDEAAVRSALLSRYSLEIGAGLGSLAGKIWRIGLMGQSANLKNVILCLASLEETLAGMDAPINQGVAIAAAQAALK